MPCRTLVLPRDIKAVLDNQDFINNKKSTRKLNLPETNKFKTENTNLDIDVVVEDIDACPRYTGITIQGIEVKESPEWLKNRLNAIGLRPINNIVDITNYVLHETGQPLHAFDAEEIKGDKVVVKKMSKGSKFVTLDEIERELTGDDLMICDTEKGMCIGGVFGGINSGITEKTKNIFLESAYFDPVHIRKTSKHHDLQTDASFRFERGVDPDVTVFALKRAAQLIKEIAGGTISSEVKDVYPKPLQKVEVLVLWKNIDRLIGKTIGQDVIKNILNSLEFDILSEEENGLKLKVPFYRTDVTREADVIEEILRVYGYNNIEIPSKQNSSISHSIKPDREKLLEIAMNYLSDNGFSEIMVNSLTKSDYYEKDHGFDKDKNVKILNPLSRDLNVMRQTLLFGGLETIVYNINRKNYDLKLFEYGNTYSLADKSSDDVTKKFNEANKLSMFVTGRKEKESWYTGDKEVDLNLLKALSYNLLQRFGIEIHKLKMNNTSKPYFSEGFQLFQKETSLVEIGEISSQLLKDFDIDQKVFFTEINWDAIVSLTNSDNIRYRAIPKFPEVRRDLALLIDRSVTFLEVEMLAYQTERKLLKEVNLFDVYEGKNIEAGKKSYAVSFILQDEEKTLNDKIIDKIMNKLMNVYKKELNAVIR